MARLDDILPRRPTSGDLYVWALQQAYESGIRLYDPDYALNRDPAAPEKIRRDPTVKQAIHDRLTSIAGKTWRMEPASESEIDREAAAVIEDLFRKIDGFQAARYRLANAVIDGRRYAEIRGRRRWIAAGTEQVAREWWTPSSFKDIDARRIRWAPRRKVTGGVPTMLDVNMEIWSVDARTWVPLPETRTIISAVFEDDESRLGHGRGLRDALYHHFWAKGRVLQEGLRGLERWAQGWIVAKTDLNAPGGTGETTDTIRSNYLSAIKNMAARFGGMVVDKDDEIDALFPTGSGHQMVVNFLRYLDDAITRLITGALLPSGGGESGGSLARAEVEEDTQERIVQFDRSIIDEAITRRAVSLVWHLNRENLVAVGLADAQMPQFKTVHEKREDPEKAVGVITNLLASRVPIKKDEVYRKTGLTPPAEDDEVFDGLEAAQFETGGLTGLPDFTPGLVPDAADAFDPTGGEQVAPPVAGDEEIVAEGHEPPSMQELSLAYERAVKNRDRATATITRRKLWAIMGEDGAPDISDAEWKEMTTDPEPPAPPGGEAPDEAPGPEEPTAATTAEISL